MVHETLRGDGTSMQHFWKMFLPQNLYQVRRRRGNSYSQTIVVKMVKSEDALVTLFCIPYEIFLIIPFCKDEKLLSTNVAASTFLTRNSPETIKHLGEFMAESKLFQ